MNKKEVGAANRFVMRIAKSKKRKLTPNEGGGGYHVTVPLEVVFNSWNKFRKEVSK